MASDLGAWPAEQASVLLEVLQRDGLTPEAKRSRDGIHVYVPDAQSDQAHQVLAANMDVIASAARPGSQSRGRPRARGPRRGDGDELHARRKAAKRSRLFSERMMRTGPVVILVLVALLVANWLPRGFTLPVLIVGTFAGIWLLGKQAQNSGEG